jgi:hypothetical protein
MAIPKFDDLDAMNEGLKDCTDRELLIGLFMWLDGRQTERYNGFSRWSEIFSKMLGEDLQQIRDDVMDIKQRLKP